MHIPFCKQACNYCNFHFTTSLRYKPQLVSALVKETEREQHYLQGAPIETIYFGGGTPSLLDTTEVEAILNSIRKNFPVAAGAEVTLEANPDDITALKLSAWKDLGINRLSIGVQSFFEEELRWMNRAHNSHQAREGLELAVQAFDNITMDLIYGSPLLTDEMWKANVDRATSLGIAHLSCYALTVEEKTPLHKAAAKEQALHPDPDKQARQFLLLMEWLREKGYDHYEVSNFARPGYRSRHNSSYWKGVPYLGLGPSAHSYNGVERRWNIANNNRYIAGMEAGEPERETEILSPADKLNETIMISLRTREGLSLPLLEKQWGPIERARVEAGLQKFQDTGLVYLTEGIASLTDEGMLRADGIAADLFV